MRESYLSIEFEAYTYKIPVWDAVKASVLEYTDFASGRFMNTLVTGTPKGQTEALDGMRPWAFVVDVVAGNADLPDDRSSKLTLTAISDVAKFVTAALDLDEWDKEIGMVGSTVSYNKVVTILERVTRRKFLVKRNSLAEMQELTKGDYMTAFVNQVRIAIEKGGLVVPPTLNERLSEVKAIGVEDWIAKWWGGVEIPEPRWTDDDFMRNV